MDFMATLVVDNTAYIFSLVKCGLHETGSNDTVKILV